MFSLSVYITNGLSAFVSKESTAYPPTFSHIPLSLLAEGKIDCISNLTDGEQKIH